MSTLQLSSCGSTFCSPIPSSLITTSHSTSKSLAFSRGKIRAVSTAPKKSSETEQAIEPEQQIPLVDFAFVNMFIFVKHVEDRKKLRDLMLDGNIELYGPYARPLLNCAGGGTCGTCMVEVIKGKELLTPRTDKEKKHLQKEQVIEAFEHSQRSMGLDQIHMITKHASSDYTESITSYIRGAYGFELYAD